MKRFGLIGAAGYIAPRHLAAIKATGGDLVAAVDVSDNVGILDSYFPDAAFYTEFEQFEHGVDTLKAYGAGLDYVAIASPNYLHATHIRFALRSGAAAICEKPLVLDEASLDDLSRIERETGGRLSTILQLRLHPAIIATRDRVNAQLAADPSRSFDVDLTYVTARGPWYAASWKGDGRRSGGILANIGVHFFDMLAWIFGPARDLDVAVLEPDVAQGAIRFGNANVRWLLSISQDDLPSRTRVEGKRAFRSMTIDGAEVEFSDGFNDLHTLSYRAILDGRGFGIEDARPSIRLIDTLRRAPLSGKRRQGMGECLLVGTEH